MVGRSCFFVGHRETPPELLPVLTYAIEQHISKYGVTEFIVRGYGSFDRLAAHAVIYAKQQHPQILLLRLIPYYSEAQSIELPRGFDGTFSTWHGKNTASICHSQGKSNYHRPLRLSNRIRM